MRNMFLYVITVIIISVVTVVCVAVTNEDKNIEFLKSYGWIVKEKYIEKENIEIPEVFDKVYCNYNELQKQAGLDLLKYRGKSGVRYTYKVENYPREVGEPVRANVISIDGNPIAGDIMTVSFRGFMHSLNYPSKND